MLDRKSWLTLGLLLLPVALLVRILAARFPGRYGFG